MPNARLDLKLCVSSGQVFRWKALGEGAASAAPRLAEASRPDDISIVGVEGEYWYLVRCLEAAKERQESLPPSRFEVESNCARADFEHLFRLDWDAEEIELEVARIGPELVPYFDALRGLRLMRPSSASETFFCFLCTPNNNITRITSMISKLAEYGEPMAELEGHMLHRFPTVERISEIPESELRAKGFGYRGGTIPNIARQVLDRGDNWLETLKQKPYEEAHAELLEIKGIGPKLADCIALFALDKTEAVPVDTHLWQAFTRLYHPEWAGASLTDARYQQAAGEFRTRFGKLSGWAHQYLFYDNVLRYRERR